MAPGDPPRIQKDDPLRPADSPEGSVPPPGAGFALPGPSGVPLGANDPLQADQERDKPKPHVKPSSPGMELNLVGFFKNPFDKDPQGERDQVAKGLWFPSTDDFLAVAGSGKVVSSAWAFVLEIAKATRPITRLNFFSHSMIGLIAMQGIIDPAGSVALGTSPDSTWTQVHFAKAIVDPYANKWGDSGENSSQKITLDSTKLSLDDIRAKFTSDAVLWLYLCNGASDQKLHQEVANTFQVTTKGFDVAIVYCVPSGFPANRKHKLTPQTTTKPVDSCPNAVGDFHKLDGNSRVRTMMPQKP